MPAHWTETPIHVIDFEGSRATGVVEYGAVTILRGGILSAKTRLCAPIADIPPEETRIHGISKADTGGQAPFAAEQDLFMDMRSTGPLCAHNAAFERHLLKAVWPYPRTSPDFLNPDRNLADWGPFIDTLRLYELVFPTLSEHGLSALLDAFGLKEQLDMIADDHCPSGRRKYHCALYDALGSAMLLTHMGRLPGYEDLPLEWLLVHSQSADDEAGQMEMF
jgi:DNA polymerase III epsilon subunit-like protein